MPPLAELGFTSQLRETLIVSRSKLDDWVEHEKAKADAAAEQFRQTRNVHQQMIDEKITNLLALQLEGGLSVAETNKPVTDSAMEEIKAQKEAVKAQMVVLEQQLADKKDQIEGM